MDVVARVGGVRVERLACHPRLPLVAGWAAERPAVHVWDGRLTHLGVVGADSPDYAGPDPWDRGYAETPVVAWHPEQPVLVVSTERGVVSWSEAGVSEVDRVPPHGLAFSPDGRTLWTTSGDLAWPPADANAQRNVEWDTGIAVHPAGGLVATLQSDQGATHVLFLLADRRVLRRALILDADGYGTPVFSAAGRHLAIRGNAYENSLAVFEFPSLKRVLDTVLGEPCPGYPYPDERIAENRSWSRHNIAFTDKLWIGTPRGTLVAVDVETGEAAEHDVGDPVTALTATATNDLAVATATELLVVSTAATATPDPLTVQAFLESTSEVPEGEDLDEYLVLSDGTRAWVSDDLETVTTAEDTDPMWLRMRAEINKLLR